MGLHDWVTDFSARQVFGIGELLWAINDWWRQKHSEDWQVVTGRVETREFLRFATNGGWFSVSYSYAFGDDMFSGEFRKWIASRKTSTAETDPDTIAFSRRFPVEAQIRVRVDEQHPARSVVIP